LILNEGVRARHVPSCMLCGVDGHRQYAGVRDRRFGAPGSWDFLKCPQCGLTWLNPQPIADDIAKLYTGEFWRSSEPPSTLPGFRRQLWETILTAEFGYTRLRHTRFFTFGRLVGSVPPLRDRAGMGISYLTQSSDNRLLDVGCSCGVFLARMRDLGWEVTGIEPDPIAAARARERGLSVVDGDLRDASFPAQSFDAVTVNHVIEHVLNPVDLLRECWRILAPRGRLVVITPNVESLARRMWGASWYHLDPPRHLFLFSHRTLALCARKAMINIEVLRTSARLAWQTSAASRLIAETGQAPPARWPRKTTALQSGLFQLIEECVSLVSVNAGEELLLIARKD
jgi:2-polyprenyl-3-methyl-5-hydroxy-6-metoxy-1,4-benzoquinol methylase